MRHEVWPLEGWYVPAAHDGQEVVESVAALLVPGPHCAQVAVPEKEAE